MVGALQTQVQGRCHPDFQSDRFQQSQRVSNWRIATFEAFVDENNFPEHCDSSAVMIAVATPRRRAETLTTITGTKSFSKKDLLSTP